MMNRALKDKGFASFDAVTPKRYYQGTHRTRTPEETLAANTPLMPRMGITRLANVTGLDRIGHPVCVAVRPNSRSLATSQGKGDTFEAAMVSALMESTELWHAEHIDQAVRYATYADLATQHNVIDIQQAPIRADASFDPRCAIQWLEGLDLMSRQACYVPYELISMNLVRQPGSQPIFLESSNGLSSGNHLAEAAVHAVAEVIERDAMALWEHYSLPMRQARQVDLSTVNDQRLQEMMAMLESRGLVLGVWDATTDVGVPVYTCLMFEDPESPQWRPIPAYGGHGCHLDPVIALSRAVNEAIQSRLTAISGSRDDMFQADYTRAGNRDDHARLIQGIREPAPSLAFQTPQLNIGNSVQDDLNTLLNQLKGVGVDRVVAVDLSKEALGIPVVKIVIPALEPYYTALYRPGARARRLVQEMAA
ncbi:MAG: YcaO-like family protein [Xanthomonadales bacterium]|nr:YcaO-like family protein [Xanthomonadales bacterium]